MQANTLGLNSNRRSFLLRFLLGLFLIAFSMGFAFYRDVPKKVVQYFLFRNIIALGGHDFHMDRLSLSRNAAVIENLSFKIGQENHEITIPQIKATYRLSKVFTGQLQQIEIQSPQISLVPTQDAPLPTWSVVTSELESALKKIENTQNIAINDIHIEVKWPVNPLKLKGSFRQDDQSPPIKSYHFDFEGDDLKLNGHISHHQNIVSAHLEMPHGKITPAKYKFETPGLKIDLEKSFLDDLIKIKAQGEITTLDLEQYGHSVSPFMIDWDIQKTDTLITGTAHFHLKNNNKDEKISIHPDFDFIHIAGHVNIDADFSPHKFWIFDPLLAPFIPGVSQLEGHIKAEGEIKWKGTWQDVDTSLKIEIKNGSAHLENGEIKGLNTDFTLSKLFPFVTAQTQAIKVDHLTYNQLPIADIVAIFSTTEDGTMKYHSFKSKIFGGEISLHTFQQAGTTATDEIKFKGDCLNIELSELIKFSEIVDLTADAKLTGEGDFKYSPKGFEIIQAMLRSTSSEGKLQYKPKTDPEHKSNQAAEIAMKALEDLHFTLLEIGISPNLSTPENDIQAHIKLLGFNPKVLNGYPFEFNIQTAGQLGDLMRNAISNLAPVQNVDDVNKRFGEE